MASAAFRSFEVEDNEYSHIQEDRASLVSSFATEEQNMIRVQEEDPSRKNASSTPLNIPTRIDFNDTFELRPLNLSKNTSAFRPPRLEKNKEWVPFMLRKGPAIVLILTCWTLAALLEYLHTAAHKKQGFPTNNKIIVQLARYCPTIGVILLGFGWKSLIKDVKIITPYAAMSEKWAESRRSLLLDYIDPLEFVSVWKSAQRRHWPMFVVLIGGLLSGVLVTLANSLTFVNPSSPVRQNTGLAKISHFSFNNTLASPNGTLYMPWDYLGQQPYAAVISSRQPNGINAPWTTNDFAFESFNISQWSNTNATISTSAQAFNAPFDCVTINYDMTLINGDWYMSARAADLATANCPSSLAQLCGQSATDERGDMGWLNVTDCSQDGTDVRMLATVISNALSTNESKPLGLMCRPQYFLRQAEINVNGSTGDISGLTLESDTTQQIDIGAAMPAIITYLNFPLDPSSQAAYLGMRGAGASPSFRIPQATFYNVTQYAQYYDGRDVFFDQLFSNGRNGSDYIASPALLESEVVALANTILTQIVNSFAKKTVDVPVSGSVSIFQPRLIVRESSLRAMQSILIFMGLVSATCCTVLRPRSTLIEDPTSIAAISVLLSRSDDAVQRKLREVASLGTFATDESLTGWRWRLSGLQGIRPIIEGVELLQPRSEPQIKASRKSRLRELFLVPGTLKHMANPKGYQPLAFRLSSRLFLSSLFVAVIVTLAVLLRVSNTNDGFPAETSTASVAWSFVPTSILVILGYCLSSIDSVLMGFAPYLARRKISEARPMLFSPNSSAFTMPFRALVLFGSASLAISSFTTLFYPAVNIVVAGLYTPVGSFQTKEIQMTVDKSLVENFEDMYQQFPYTSSGDMATMIERASQFAEWTLIPQFGVLQRPGVLQNLAFGNLTDLDIETDRMSDLSDRLAVRLPAIAVNVTCTYFGTEHFQPFVSNFGSGNYLFSMQCSTESCNSTIGEGELVTKTLTSNTSISPSNYYIGSATIPGLGPGGLNSTFDLSYNVVLANLSSIMVPFTNLTLINGTSDVEVTPGMLNFTNLPLMVAVSCNKTFWEVNVNTTITRSVKSSLNDTVALPWAVSAYDDQSITYQRQYNNTIPLWGYPVPNTADQYASYIDGALENDSLWPSIGKSTNFFELLAAYQQYYAGNLNGMFAPNQLAVAAEVMFTAYCVQMLTELRTYTSSISNGSTQILSGTITTPLVRMKQDTAATIAILIMLGIMFVGLLWTFIRYPKDFVLPKPPTSIAAQMSLLAGSSFVQELRDGHVESTKDTNIWNRKFRLGWWPENENGEHEEHRWGIDIEDNIKARAPASEPI